MYEECGNISPSRGSGPKKFWRMLRKKGRHTRQSPFKEELELVKRKNDLGVNAMLMRRAYHAGRSGRRDGKLSVGASIKVKDRYEKVESEDKCLSIAQDILRTSTDFLVSIIAPIDGVGGVTLSHVCPHCQCFRWRTTSGGFRRGTVTATSGRRSSATGDVRRVAVGMIGGLRTGFGSYKTARTAEKQKYFEHTLHHKELATTLSTR